MATIRIQNIYFKAQLSFDATVISRVQKVGSIVPLESGIYSLWFLNIEGGNILYNSARMIFLLVKKGRYISVRIYQQHIIATISVKGPPQMRTNVDL